MDIQQYCKLSVEDKQHVRHVVLENCGDDYQTIFKLFYMAELAFKSKLPKMSKYIEIANQYLEHCYSVNDDGLS